MAARKERMEGNCGGETDEDEDKDKDEDEVKVESWLRKEGRER